MSKNPSEINNDETIAGSTRDPLNRMYARRLNVNRHTSCQKALFLIDNIFDEIVKFLSSRRIQQADKIKELLTQVILDLKMAHDTDPLLWVRYSRHKEDYSRVSRYQQNDISYDRLIPIVDALNDLGYIEHHIGFQDRNTGISFQSRMRATQKLASMITFDNKDQVYANKSSRPKETIRLKGDKKKLIHDYEDTRPTKQMRRNLKRINDKLEKTYINLKMPDEKYRAMQGLVQCRDERLPVDRRQVYLHRVFNNGSFEQGGRFYGPWWHNLPNNPDNDEYRKYITINQKPTVEVDFSGMHPSILYGKEGIDIADSDPYVLPNFDFHDSRKLLKVIFNTMLCCGEDDRASALALITDKCREYPIDRVYYPSSQAIVDAFIEKHRCIEEYFFKGYGVHLQYLDSCIAEKVMLYFLEEDAVALPVHDSFIVTANHYEFLLAAMDAAYTDVIGMAPSMKLSRPCNWGYTDGVSPEERAEYSIYYDFEEQWLSEHGTWS